MELNSAHVTGHHLVAEGQKLSDYNYVLICSVEFIQVLPVGKILNLLLKIFLSSQTKNLFVAVIHKSQLLLQSSINSLQPSSVYLSSEIIFQ